MSKELQYVLYNLPEEEGKVQVIVKDETLWCTQKAMAQLFGCSTDNVSLHLKNVFNSGELDKDSVTEKISATATEKLSRWSYLEVRRDSGKKLSSRKRD